MTAARPILRMLCRALPSALPRALSPALVAALVALAAGPGATPARADTITLRGSTIPLPGATLEDIRAGRLHYRDARGRRRFREIDDVAVLTFDALPVVEGAEFLIAGGDQENGMLGLLRALLESERELHELWLRIRLARLHDQRGEYVQSAAHAAAVFRMRDEGWWRRLEPVSPPDRPAFPMADEALDALRTARRRVLDRELQPVIERMLAVVEPIHDELAPTWTGPPVEPGSTLSGFPVEAIRRGRLDTPPPPPPAGADLPEPVTEAGDAERPGARAGGRSAAPGRVPRRTPARPIPAPPPADPDAIDALLAGDRSEAALEACARVERDPGDRGMARFLHQYGRALAANDRAADAAVMFLRSALLYEDAPFAAPSFLEAARLHRDALANPAAAERLARRAIAAAQAQGRPDDAGRAEALIAGLPGRAGVATDEAKDDDDANAR